MKKYFSAYIITESNLGLQCIEFLINEGHKVLGIVGNNPNIKKLALQYNLSHFSSLESFKSISPSKTFDYLFSIFNNNILTEEILNYPIQYAINYHDSLLPKYAGVHATSWAILNNEDTHGITWHIMNSIIDAGEILKQEKFCISLGETTLSLNLKCYTAALNTFKELITDLANPNHTISTIQQNLYERTYFSAHQKPKTLGFLDWNNSAYEIEKLFRALYFGNYLNNFATFKLLFYNQILIPHKLEILQIKSSSMPGTLIKVFESGLQVATKSTDIIISNFTDVYFNKIDIKDFSKKFQISKNYIFPTLGEKLLNELHEVITILSKSESYWKECLQKVKPIQLFPKDLSLTTGKIRDIKIKGKISDILIKKITKKLKENNFLDILICIILIHISRFIKKNSFNISFSNSFIKTLALYLEHFIAAEVPLIFEFSPNLSFQELFKKYKIIKKKNEKHKTYLNDIKERHPDLQSVHVNLEIKINITNFINEFPQSYNENTLVINIDEQGKKYVVRFVGYINEFDIIFFENFSNFIQMYLKEIFKNIDTPIHQLLFTNKDKKKTVIEWNNTKASYPQDKCIHELFEEQVETTPDNIAIVYKNKKLTYQQVNEKANQLAHYLRYLGVRHDTLVALAVERSPEMIIGLLGILKAGGAYVPLDPTYPQERLLFMLEDAKTSIILTDNQSIDKIPATFSQVICLEDSANDIASFSMANLPLISLPSHLAYIIYTSGSTGKPKGVMVEHRSVCNVIYAQSKLFSITQSHRELQFASLSFDAAVSEIFIILIKGASLYLENKENLVNQNTFVNFIKDKKINIITLPTSFLGNLSLRNLSSIETLVIAGEPPSLKLLEFWGKDRHLINAYGPTEGAVCASIFVYEKKYSPTTIGRPIANTQIYILDTYMNPVPIGVSGEIYIGGAGLARGYLNRADLTAEKFIPNPFINQEDYQTHQNLRLYRTGDLARYLPDGNIEFLGRIDDQVKIRGYRIELGEIESILNNYQDISNCAVIAREDEPGHKRLVAYVVPREKYLSSSHAEVSPASAIDQAFTVLREDNFSILTENIRNYLARFLPDYMIPAFFIFINRIPLTPNGKIDRKSLPAPDINEKIRSEGYVAPRNVLEEGLASIWAEVLNLKKVGIYDNFFRIGGDSLLAAQVISRIKNIYTVDIALSTLFEYPTLQALGKVIQSSEKKKFFSSSFITCKERPPFVSLSFAQQRLWFLDQLLPDIALYNIPFALKLKGHLDIIALEKSLNTLAERHESLRTIFPSKQGEAYQLVLPPFALKLTENIVDLSKREASLEELIKEEARAVFRLSEEPLIRVKLFNLSEEEHVLLIMMHHIISDGWSMKVFCKELSLLYNSYCKQEIPELPTLPIQYADFALWQREWLQGDALEQQLSYWKNQLSGIPDFLMLPTYRPRPKELTYVGSIYCYSLHKEVKVKLNEIAYEYNSSLFMVILSMFKILLYRYTGQKDIIIGSPIANRHHQEIEGIIGFFVNTLALRTILEGGESFVQVLSKVKETTLQAYQYQDVPFENLVDYLKVPRSLNQNPIFQIMFMLHNFMEDKTLSLQDLHVESLEHISPLAKFDLSLSACEHEDGIDLKFEYMIDLFEGNTIKQIAQHFEELTKQIILNPNQTINDLSILGQGEKEQILIEWNDTRVDYLTNKCIHQLFEEQVEKTPDNIAIVCNHQNLTYKQLNEMSNQLAHHLRRLGIGPDTLVAIAVERSLEMTIGLLGILKAGGAYVPLDPSYPQKRLQFMLEDTNAPILLTQSHLRESLKEMLTSYRGHIINLDQQAENLTQESRENPLPITLPYHLAYVIYTSGSTGIPKGVGVAHHSVDNNLRWTKTYYNVSDKDIFLHTSSINFDISLWEILFPLFIGACLVFTKKDEISLDKIIDKNRITIAFFVPSLLSLFISSKESSACKCLAHVITGGEALSNDLKNKFFASFDKTSLYVAYGPTETTISVMHWDCRETKYSDKILIGRPIANTQIYILDTYMNPVPIGVSGEIYIGGAGLARGYLNRADLTAEKFIPNPFINQEDYQTHQNLRLYRTGDLARYLPDGNIEFLGRIDDQVKIRGYRIELGEIESILNNYQDISNCAVIAREDEPGHKRLVAYVVPREKYLSSSHAEVSPASAIDQAFTVLREDNFSILTENIRNYLARFLPDYMIPAFFIFINRIPLTPNGKIDRKSLPAPDINEKIRSEGYVAPRNVLEEGLASIWAEVLNLKKVGIHDNFFRIGGDSIISIQIVAKARQKGIYLAVKDIFNRPTIADLISVIKTQESSKTLKACQDSVSGIIPLTPIQRWFFEQSFSNQHHYNQAILLCVHNRIDYSLFQQTLKILLSHHDMLRNRYYLNESSLWQQECIVDEDLVNVWKVVDFAHISDNDLASKIEQEVAVTQGCLNIINGPLIKVFLFDCGENRPARLLIIIHHLVTDGVSWRILLEDLENIYTQLLKEQVPSLPPKTHSYQQWAYALQTYAQSEDIKLQISYWQVLNESISSLPRDFNKRSIKYPSIATISRSLTKKETINLLQQVPKAYRTQINDILLTALILAIGDWTQEYCITLSLEGHGREDIIHDIDLSRTIGWFTAIFPVQLKIDNPNDLGEAIKKIKEELRQVPHKGIGYGILSYLTQNSPLSIHIYPDLSFNYLGQWDNIISQNKHFTFANELISNSVSNSNQRPYLLDINCEIRHGIFHIFYLYSCNHYRQTTVEKFADNFMIRLKQIIQHCCQEKNFGYTSSDFNLVSLSQTTLDTAFDNIPYIESIYPLSPMQFGLLFQALYAPKATTYFVQSIFKLEGNVDLAVLKSAWEKVVKHHSILRTGIVWEHLEDPLQYVLESGSISFQKKNWQALNENDQEIRFKNFIKEDRLKGFDLSKPPLCRLTAIQYTPYKYHLILSQHHILLDGWSLSVVLKDIFKVYKDIKSGKEGYLKPSQPYHDYITWLERQDVNRAECFWKDYLYRLEGPTHFSFKDRVKKNNEKDYDTLTMTLSLEETEIIKKFSQQYGLTLNTVIQGIVGFVLTTYTQRPEIVLGVTVSGRSINLPNVEEMVGLFINTLPLRIVIQPNETVISFLKNLQAQMQRLNEYTYTSLAQIQAWSGFNQSLFDVLFVFENYPVDEDVLISESEFSVKSFQSIEKTEYPLTIVAVPGKQMHLILNYQTKHFDEESLKRLSKHISQILESIMQHSKSLLYSDIKNHLCSHFFLRDLSILGQGEKEQILIEWNDTRVDYLTNKCIHQLFEEQVEKTPDNIAIVCNHQNLTYKQLNEMSNQLAHHLRRLGIGPDTLVAIAVERSLEMTIGLLGILKAGGAYVPLDPSYPQKRLQFMLEDTNAPILLTQSHLRESLKEMLTSYRGHIINLDQQAENLTQESRENPLPITLPYHLAYVIYTSGSTGIPKGVMINHSSVIDCIFSILNKVKINNKDIFLTITSLSFDVAALDYWLPLAVGSKVIIVNQDSQKDPLEMIKLLNLYSISCMQATPSIWQMLLDSGWEGNSNFKMLAAGEPLTSEIAQMLNHKGHLFNIYGPTETTIYSSFAKITRSSSSISIGNPLPNTQIYILDAYMNPVPISVNGEIYIGGAGLARGYLNRADLTAERFVPNPFINQEDYQTSQNLRLYRTGDLARYLPDGNIEFLGRIDDQVKIRGYRIELGEIESILNNYEDISNCVVIAREDEPGYKRLVAYVVSREKYLSSSHTEVAQASATDQALTVLKEDNFSTLTENIRNYLARFLPDYMIPAFFIFINKIPLTPNGKIDRKSLPAPDINEKIRSEGYVAPRNILEEGLTSIWAEVLNLEKVGIHDNFFRIGGHSLLATQAISKINEKLFKKISIIDIFKNPTIDSLSKLMELDFRHPPTSPLISIQPDGKENPLFLVHPGGGLAHCYSLLANYITDIPIYGINNPNFEEPTKRFNNIEDMAKFYVSLIKKKQGIGPYILGGWSIGGLIAYEMAQQLFFQNDRISCLLLIDSDNPNPKINNRKKALNFIAQKEEDLPLEDIIDPKIRSMIEFNIKDSYNKANEYFPSKYKGKVVLLKAKDNEFIESSTNNYGWEKFINNINIVNIPGTHSNLFDYNYIKSTALAIKRAVYKHSTGRVK